MPKSTALTIGTFDGVHIGHAALLRCARERIGATGRIVALAFEPHPLTALCPGLAPPRLTAFDQRRELLLAAGADEVHHLRPDGETLGLEPEEFIRRLVEAHRPSLIVEGCDFRFGRRRAGDFALLSALGQRHGFETICLPEVEVCLADHSLVRASSSLARWLLHHGRLRDLRRVLGHPYEVRGEVLRGQQRGRTIGFPTANLHPEQTLPCPAVYVGRATTPSGRTYDAAINVGANPTFGETYRHAEVHLIDCQELDGEYGWELRVEFHAWLRDLIRFDGPESLQAQIARDVARAGSLLHDPGLAEETHPAAGDSPSTEPARSSG
ncbi:MAG: bifunctional riboflavin kinase/FMN adenylyltransferase [Phycisphaerales bacterium JB038]